MIYIEGNYLRDNIWSHLLLRHSATHVVYFGVARNNNAIANKNLFYGEKRETNHFTRLLSLCKNKMW